MTATTHRKRSEFNTHLPYFTCPTCQAILHVHVANPCVLAEVVGHQDEMAQRYISNALARAGARKERDTSEPEENGGGNGRHSVENIGRGLPGGRELLVDGEAHHLGSPLGVENR